MEKFTFVFWLHLLVVLIIWVSPFFLDWKIVLGFIGLYYIQLLIFGDCVLTKKQFRTKKRVMTLYTFILEEFGFKVNRKLMVILADYIFPIIILGIALLRQFVL